MAVSNLKIVSGTDVVADTSDMKDGDNKIHWHTRSVEQVLDLLNINRDRGLSSDEVLERRNQYGLNELIEQASRSPLIILREQLLEPLVLLLLLAAVVSAFLDKGIELIAILAIVVLNAVLGVVQEYRAEKAMAALKQMAAPIVRVKRDGKITEIPAKELVPGDIVMLEAGAIVPADSRLLETASLRVQEASLTGESEPVDKFVDVTVEANALPGDRQNMLFMGTSVTYGRASVLVTTTGMNTELGRIAGMIQSVESEKTPLQRRISELGRVLIQVAVIVMIISFIVGMINGAAFEDVLLSAVAIAVAVVPEGLPAVITVALALGAQRMLRRKALIRTLPAVETLGSVTTICSDKTGTLTENRMTVTVMDVAGNTFDAGDTSVELTETQQTAHNLVLIGDMLCNDAMLATNDNSTAQGDPTELALLAAGREAGFDRDVLTTDFPRVNEIPFSSERKRMSTVHQINADMSDKYAALSQYLPENSTVIFTKGAVDSLLPVTGAVFVDGGVVPLDEALRTRIATANDNLAQRGLRVLGLAYRVINDGTLPQDASVEADLIFVGMVGIIDPPREEVTEAVRVCKQAGIRPVMITGDHPLTAFAIAREIGIADASSKILTGRDLSQMSDADLDREVRQVSVYARVSPEHKLKIVQALQAQGEVVAMTGDGVNDAPALKRSNIGVAMGITGTAVSKEASNMVLVDDNFATIVSAVEEGRTIYDNVRRFIKYLLASNTGELFVLLTMQMIQGMSIPLTTLQILWMNLVTDGVPALALGVEQSEKGVMTRQPYDPNESLFGQGLGRHILLVGFVLGGGGLALGYYAWANNLQAANGQPAWNTMVFIFLTIAQMGHALGLRSHRESFFTMGFKGNRLLIGAVLFTVFVQMLAIYTPFFNDIFGTNPLTPEQLLLCFVLSTIVFWGVELEKLLMRRGIVN